MDDFFSFQLHHLKQILYLSSYHFLLLTFHLSNKFQTGYNNSFINKYKFNIPYRGYKKRINPEKLKIVNGSMHINTIITIFKIESENISRKRVAMPSNPAAAVVKMASQRTIVIQISMANE